MGTVIIYGATPPTSTATSYVGTSLPTASATSPEYFFLVGGASQGTYARRTDGTSYWYVQVSN